MRAICFARCCVLHIRRVYLLLVIVPLIARPSLRTFADSNFLSSKKTPVFLLFPRRPEREIRIRSIPLGINVQLSFAINTIVSEVNSLAQLFLEENLLNNVRRLLFSRMHIRTSSVSRRSSIAVCKHDGRITASRQNFTALIATCNTATSTGERYCIWAVKH